MYMIFNENNNTCYIIISSPYGGASLICQYLSSTWTRMSVCRQSWASSSRSCSKILSVWFSGRTSQIWVTPSYYSWKCLTRSTHLTCSGPSVPCITTSSIGAALSAGLYRSFSAAFQGKPADSCTPAAELAAGARGTCCCCCQYTDNQPWTSPSYAGAASPPSDPRQFHACPRWSAARTWSLFYLICWL